MSILTALHLEFEHVEMKGNRLLPKWLGSEINNNILCFYGKPEIRDVGEILIRIKSETEKPLLEFIINVEEEETEK